MGRRAVPSRRSWESSSAGCGGENKDTIAIAGTTEFGASGSGEKGYGSFYRRGGKKEAHLLEPPAEPPFPEIEAFPSSKVQVPAAAASVESDRARKAQMDLSEATVKRIVGENGNRRREFFCCWIRVARGLPFWCLLSK